MHACPKTSTKKYACRQYILIMPNSNRYSILCNTVTNVRAVT
jgi:hypothetical protein